MRVGVVTEMRLRTGERTLHATHALHLVEPRGEGQSAAEWLKDVVLVPPPLDKIDTPTLATAMWTCFILTREMPEVTPVALAMFDVPDGATVAAFLRPSTERHWEDDAAGDEFVRVKYPDGLTRTVAAVYPSGCSPPIPDEHLARAIVVPPEKQKVGIVAITAKDVTLTFDSSPDTATE